MTRIIVNLKEAERAALCKLAEKEFRDPRTQAALLIRRALEDTGYLKAELPMNTERSADTPDVNSPETPQDASNFGTAHAD